MSIRSDLPAHCVELSLETVFRRAAGTPHLCGWIFAAVTITPSAISCLKSATTISRALLARRSDCVSWKLAWASWRSAPAPGEIRDHQSAEKHNKGKNNNEGSAPS